MAVVVTSIVIARHVSIDVFGLYLFVMSCVSLGSLILTGALDVALLRHVPRCVVADALSQSEKLFRLLRWATLKFGRQSIVLLLVLALVIVLAFGAAQVRDWPLSEQFDPLLIVVSLVLVGVLSCIAIVRGFLQGLATRWATLPEQWLHPMLVLGLVTSSMLLSNIPTVTQLVGYSVLASLVALGVAALWSQHRAQYLVSQLVPHLVQHPDEPIVDSATQNLVRNVDGEPSRWSAGLRAVFVLAAAQLVLAQGDLLILGLLRGPIDVGFYGAVVQLLLIFSFGLAATNAVFAPRFNQLLAKADLLAIARISRCLLGLALGVTSILILVLWFAAPWLLGLFGEAYVTTDTLLAMRILLVTQLALALAVLMSYLLVMAGRVKQAAVITTMAAAVNLVLNLALVSRLGLVGAAAATAAALCLHSLIAWWFARRLGLI